MKIILEKISDVIDLSSLSQEERDRYVLERANKGIALAQAGAIPSDVVTFILANYIKLNWRGVWSSESSYNYNDAVSYLGSSYVAIRTTSEQPGEGATDWNLIAGKGGPGSGTTRTLTFTTSDWVSIAGGYELSLVHGLEAEVHTEIYSSDAEILCDKIPFNTNTIKLRVPIDYRFDGYAIIKN